MRSGSSSPTLAPSAPPEADKERPSLATRPRERKEGVLLDLFLELARDGDRHGHHRLDWDRLHGEPDAASYNGEDRLLRLLPCPTSGRSAGDHRIEKVPELQLEDLVEVIHL